MTGGMQPKPSKNINNRLTKRDKSASLSCCWSEIVVRMHMLNAWKTNTGIGDNCSSTVRKASQNTLFGCRRPPGRSYRLWSRGSLFNSSAAPAQIWPSVMRRKPLLNPQYNVQHQNFDTEHLDWPDGTSPVEPWGSNGSLWLWSARLAVKRHRKHLSSCGSIRLWGCVSSTGGHFTGRRRKRFTEGPTNSGSKYKSICKEAEVERRMAS